MSNLNELTNVQNEKNELEGSCLSSKPLSDYQTQTVEWLWQDRIPNGCVTLLEGEGGCGKSFVVAALSSSISKGRALPEDEVKTEKSILLLAAEDDPSVVLRPRFESHDADLDKVRCYDQAMLLDKDGLSQLDAEIEKYKFGLVVIDPIVSFLGVKIDTSKATDVRSVMGPLHEIARKHNCAIIVVRHWTKNATAQASHRGSGSVDFRNAARSVLQVIKSGDQTFLTLEKSNYGRTGKTITFQIDNGQVSWTGTSNLSADEILSEISQQNLESKSELEEAVGFLEEELKNGPIKSKVLHESAKDIGISLGTLKRARSKLGVIGFKMTGYNEYFAGLPTHVAQNEGCGSSSARKELEPHPSKSACFASTTLQGELLI